MILPIAGYVFAKALDFAPDCVLDRLFGAEEEFEYKGSTTPS